MRKGTRPLLSGDYDRARELRLCEDVRGLGFRSRFSEFRDWGLWFGIHASGVRFYGSSALVPQPSGNSSRGASFGLADYSQVDTLYPQYKSVNFVA